MSGGSYTLTGRSLLLIYGTLGMSTKLKASRKMLYGKMRNRIEKLLRMEEQEGARVFLRLKPAFKLAYHSDGKPMMGQDGNQAKYWEYDEAALKKPAGEFRFDSVERGALLELLAEQIEDDKATGDQAGLCLRIAGWLGMSDEIEKRVLLAHPLDAYSGAISEPERDDLESIPEG